MFCLWLLSLRRRKGGEIRDNRLMHTSGEDPGDPEPDQRDAVAGPDAHAAEPPAHRSPME